MKKPNAWKKYGALFMAGVILTGASAISGQKYARAEEETEQRITLNIADRDQDDTKDTEETASLAAEEETEERIHLNLASDDQEGEVAQVEETEEISLGADSEEEETTEKAAEDADTEEENVSEAETQAAEEITLGAEDAEDAEDAAKEKQDYEQVESVNPDQTAIVAMDVSEIVEQVMPSIVAITETSVATADTMYGTQEYESTGSASGVIIAQTDDELLVATNSHVIEDSVDVNVTFTVDAEDESLLTVPAKVKGNNSAYELAVVAIQLSDIDPSILSQLKIAVLGSSDELKVGQTAIAIGNALGYGQTVTCGIISALNKDLDMDDFDITLIQTDAAINFGNSGGALLNAKGEVIGINVAKEVGTGTEAIGYSIPIDTAIPILEELINRETRDVQENHGYLGISVVDVSDDAKELYDMPAGAFVYSVNEGGPAEAAGIKKGDVITCFDGVTISSRDELVDLVSYYAPGETVTVEIQTANAGVYEAHEVTVTLEEGAADTTDSAEDADEDNVQEYGQEEAPDEQNPEDGSEDEENMEDFYQDFYNYFFNQGNGEGQDDDSNVYNYDFPSGNENSGSGLY